MANFQPGISDVFHALADPTRCAIVSALGDGGRTVSELAAPFDMALPSFMKHVAVLERSGLVQTRKAGRSRTCELVGGRLAEAEQWLAAQRALWEARADRLVEFVERRHQEEYAHVSKPRRTRRSP
ncbi:MULTISPECIES: ArsR/SmtB family transcription factor [unclassified Burkholderia]|uniref:ArsR/SmtB family transcription factor n=1 Tax=unclassified Burkholderia TaxID=2613784 RepID=UPI000F58E52A|nr:MULTISPECIES: metalloregulator ArsR/SmtB family transcription factor [unclassified Burkholderia]RQR32002.1 transcriptional regulator [Burkholderia sp. Bp9142]RQR54272.1 transcriptional regulator [Burkholderia sp. Bp9140]